MNKSEVMKTLKAAGNESARKTYTRHGITGDAFGVRYADLYKLQKEIGTDQALAEQLWATGNHDARVLATLILEPAKMKASTLDQWVRTVTSQFVLDAVAVTVRASTAHGRLIPMQSWSSAARRRHHRPVTASVQELPISCFAVSAVLPLPLCAKQVMV